MENKQFIVATEEDIRKRFGDKFMKNYRHRPNTVILVNKDNHPVLLDNNDGTYSGMPVSIIKHFKE